MDITHPGQRLRKIRKAEGLSLAETAALVDMPARTLKAYEVGERVHIPYQALIKFTRHPRFQKYTLWLMNGDLAGVEGQQAPDNP